MSKIIRLAVNEVVENVEWCGGSHMVTRYAVTLNGVEIARASARNDALRGVVSKVTALANVLEVSDTTEVEIA